MMSCHGGRRIASFLNEAILLTSNFKIYIQFQRIILVVVLVIVIPGRIVFLKNETQVIPRRRFRCRTDVARCSFLSFPWT